nr:homeodomain transcription factor bW [Sporisorium sorghi]
MSASAISTLSQMHALATEILSLLPEASSSDHRSSPLIQLDPPRLDSPLPEILLQDLVSFEIPAESQTALINLYERMLKELQLRYLDKYKEAAISLHYHGRPDKYFYDSFRSALELKFSRQAQIMWHGIIEEVRSLTGANQSCLAGPPDFGPGSHASSDDTTSKSGRGHDLDAIRILEQAFEITPNITQAEKFRLAEVTGLQPKQVTIWFQNRRNRKGRKGLSLQPVGQSPIDHSSTKQASPPPSSPTRDFTLSEKKRKSYGALGRSSTDSFDSDSDSPPSDLKRPRLPSVCSDDTDGSASSVDQIRKFTPWSTPSSRSTSSSSASSSGSDLFDSPTKPCNLFKYMKPKYEGRANASMPILTLATPQQSVNRILPPAQRSPFTSDVQGGANFKGLDLRGLQFNMDEAFSRELRESVQRVFTDPNFDAGSYRSVSSSSWGSQQATTDDDGWVDEDDFDASLGGRHNTPVEVVAHGQPVLTPPGAQSNHAAVSGQTPWQIASSPAVANGGADASANGGFSCAATFDNEPFDLSQFLNPASGPMHDNSANLPCADLDLDLEMTELQSFLESDMFASSLPSSQQSSNAASNEGVQQGNISEAQFEMNFDLTSNAFHLSLA